MTGTHQQAEQPCVAKWGKGLLGASLGAMTIGGTTVELFFPGLKGRGLDVVSLSILIPIWAVGVTGILLLLWAWVRYPGLNTKLEVDIPERSDGKLFGPFTKSLACFALVLVWLACLTLWTEPEKVIPLWKKCLVFYCVTVYCWFLLYLIVWYASARHHATTTYLNHFSPLIGVLLVPLTWVPLIVLNWVVGLKEGEAADSGVQRWEANDRAEQAAAADRPRD